MLRRMDRHAIVLAVILSACSSVQSWDSSPKALGRGARLVVVLDTSGSMEKKDRHLLATLGAHLAVALASADDDVGLVAFDDRAEVVVPVATMGEPGARNSAHRAISGLVPQYGTNFIAALEVTRDMIASRTSPGTVHLVFLTDGQHGGGDTVSDADLKKIEQLTADYAGRDWRLHCMSVGLSADTTLTRTMAAQTTGSYSRVIASGGLIDAYIQVLSGVYNLFFLDHTEGAVEVSELARRLVVIRDGEGVASGQIQEHLLAGGQPAAPAQADTWFGSARKAGLETVQFQGSSLVVGTWIFPTGLPGRTRIAMQPRFLLSVGKAGDKSDYTWGEEIEIRVAASSKEPGVREQLKDLIEVTALVTRQDEDHAFAEFRCDDVRQENDSVVFRGRFPLELRPIQQDWNGEHVDVNVAIGLKGTGWKQEHAFSVNVLPLPDGPERITIRVPERDLDLGDFWIDEAPDGPRFTLQNQGTSTVSVEAHMDTGEGGGGSIELGGVTMEALSEAALDVDMAPLLALGPGAYAGRIVFTGHKSTPLREPVDFPFGWRAFQVQGEPPTGPVQVPGTGVHRVKILPWAILPETHPDAYDLHVDRAIPNVHVELRWEGSAPGLVFEQRGHTPGGSGELTIAMKPEGTDLEPRMATLAFRADPTPPLLAAGAEEIRVRLDNEVAVAELPLRWEHYSPFHLEVQATPLAHQQYPGLRLIPGPDFRFALSAGEPSAAGEDVLRVEIRRPGRALPGEYLGRFTIHARDQEGRGPDIVVPVVLEIP